MTNEILPQFIEIPPNKYSLAKRKLICGIGINDALYMTEYKIHRKRLRCPYYSVWTDMLKRCYSEKLQLKRPTYIGCSMVKEWHTFSNFRKWMEQQNWEGKELDKDILVVGNKIYSPEKCVFVIPSVNSLLTHIQRNKSKWPIGVSFDSNKYRSQCWVNGKHKHIGMFGSPEEASAAYKIVKSNEIKRVALLQSDIRIKDGLMRHAEHLLNL